MDIESLHQLVNEWFFPRSDRCKDCARQILNFFPPTWSNLLQERQDLDTEKNYQNFFLTYKWQPTQVMKVTVKGIRTILRDCQPTLPKPYLNEPKFELQIADINTQHNPFLLAREALHAPRDRFYKYRLLHGDVFCKNRMFKFKMVNSPYCSICPEDVETIQHLLWTCPRSARVWNYLNTLTSVFMGENYISYNTIILGNSTPNMAMETMIVWVLKLITAIERESFISNEVIFQKFHTLFHYEKKMFGRNSKKMVKRWGNILQLFMNEQQ